MMIHGFDSVRLIIGKKLIKTTRTQSQMNVSQFKSLHMKRHSLHSRVYIPHRFGETCLFQVLSPLNFRLRGIE